MQFDDTGLSTSGDQQRQHDEVRAKQCPKEAQVRDGSPQLGQRYLQEGNEQYEPQQGIDDRCQGDRAGNLPCEEGG